MPRESTTGMIYAGTFHRAMDAKNRVTIPSEWLSKEGDVLFILPQRNRRYLNVMPEAVFAAQEDELRAKLSATAWRALMREVFSAARRIEPDKQGRILVPDEFCKAVELQTNVTFVGVKNSFEIWDAAKWSSAAANKQEELPADALQALDDLGL